MKPSSPLSRVDCRSLVFAMLMVGSVAVAVGGGPSAESTMPLSPLPQACPTGTCVVPTFPPLPPSFPATYAMNLSTIVMPCNSRMDDGGWSNASFFASFGIVDYDWSNAKAFWSKVRSHWFIHPIIPSLRHTVVAQHIIPSFASAVLRHPAHCPHYRSVPSWSRGRVSIVTGASTV